MLQSKPPSGVRPCVRPLHICARMHACATSTPDSAYGAVLQQEPRATTPEQRHAPAWLRSREEKGTHEHAVIAEGCGLNAVIIPKHRWRPEL